MFDIEKELKKIPNKPGVYIMKDKNDTILYVGKAILLNKRVRQYFRKNNKTPRIEKMVSLIDHFEYIVTANEVEALILECNLIKKHRPKFNVLLKDDKNYPYIKVTINEEFPNIFSTRRKLEDGAKYFGPYTNAGSVRELIEFIKKNYKLRLCRNIKGHKRECLNYHINKCPGMCVGKISKEEYKETIAQIIMLLEGKTEKILKQLEEQIQEKALELKFEEAALLRDRIIAIQNLSQKQKMSNINENDIDVIGVSKIEDLACLQIFFVRNSKLLRKRKSFY